MSKKLFRKRGGVKGGTAGRLAALLLFFILWVSIYRLNTTKDLLNERSHSMTDQQIYLLTIFDLRYVSTNSPAPSSDSPRATPLASYDKVLSPLIQH